MLSLISCFFLKGLCMWIHIHVSPCVYTHTCVHAHLCACVWKARINIVFLLQSFSMFIFEMGPFKPGAFLSCQAGQPGSIQDSFVSAPALGLQTCAAPSLLCGFQGSGLHAFVAVTLPTEPSAQTSPKYLFLRRSII